MDGLLSSTGHEAAYDSALMAILQNCGKLHTFLESVFSFLARRTDFYLIMQHDRAKMGFLPGVSEKMVMQAFKKFEILTRKREAEIMREEEQKKKEQLELMSAPPPADELPISLPSSSDHNPFPATDRSKVKLPPTDRIEKKTKSTSEKEKEKEKPKPKLTEKEKEKPTATPPTPTPPTTATASATTSSSTTAAATAEDTGTTEAVNLASDTFNGGVMEDYRWAQTITDVDVRVPVDAGTKAKDVSVTIKSDHLKVELLKPERKVVLDKPLLHRIKVLESMWSVDKNCVLINLEKTKEIMWKSVLEGEKGIDMSKIDNTRPMSDFDAEAQAAIERVTYDQHMKMLGKPTSGEQRAHEILRKAWDVEGSPFKGTPFDPSRVQISGNW